MTQPPETLKTRAVRALSWSLIQEVAMRGLQLGLGVVLARLLSPKEFGLVAMLSVFLSVAQALVDSGFASALIKEKNPTEEHKCSVFYFNIFLSLLLAGALWLAAPGIAWFYGQPPLTRLLRWMVALPVINSLAVVQNTLLIRHLDFRKQTIMLVLSVGISGMVGIGMAWRGYGVWSLVAQSITQSLVRVVLLWRMGGWRPKWLFRVKALREMFRFGWGILASSLLNSAYDNIYQMIIGKVFSAADLGYYNRAQGLQTNASYALGAITNRVTFPLFSGLQEDLIRFRSSLRRAMTTIAFVQFPLMVGLVAVARPLVLVVFTDKWAPSIPYLQLLSLASMLYPIHLLNLNVLLALGRSDLFFRLGVVKLVIFSVCGLLSFHWGIMAMLWAQIACTGIFYFLNSHYTKQLIGYSTAQQISDLYPYLAAASLMGLVVMLAGAVMPLGNIGQVCFRVPLGAAVYYVICQGLRLTALADLSGLVFRKGTAPA